MKNFIKMLVVTAFSLSAITVFSGCGGDSGAEGGSQAKVEHSSSSGGINYSGFDAGFEEATATERPIIMFFETSWCTWCKKLKSTTLADPMIINKINDLFVAVVVDGEGSKKVTYMGDELTETEFTKKVQVRGYPTMLFFNGEGGVILGQPGYLDSKQMDVLLNYVGEGVYKTGVKFQDYMEEQLS
ncbi:MAG: thioredoxin fold domain-containing protein [candidate division Zixibacteria bacterium]|nr:thioredoxin fold domain-containing protein [candidate division Zixibacteria bacterium]